IKEHEACLENGGEATLSSDGGGFLPEDQLPCLEQVRDTAIDALNELRKAFAISIYHYWEKWSQRWFGRCREHRKLMKKIAREAAYSVDEEMESLHRPINILKHNKDDGSIELWRKRPDLFVPWFDPEDEPDWERGIEL